MRPTCKDVRFRLKADAGLMSAIHPKRTLPFVGSALGFDAIVADPLGPSQCLAS